MENKRMCDACGEPMHRIGNFASVKVEGQPAAKHDGSCPYECINDDCPACGVTVKYSFEDEVSYSERMQQVCQCGHARGLMVTPSLMSLKGLQFLRSSRMVNVLLTIANARHITLFPKTPRGVLYVRFV